MGELERLQNKIAELTNTIKHNEHLHKLNTEAIHRHYRQQLEHQKREWMLRLESAIRDEQEQAAGARRWGIGHYS